ncbi:reverse transcriptase domain-containing protein, partial [Tanacetum coccineum]
MDVLRIQSQHQGAESMPRQGRRCLKSSIPKMLKRHAKVKQKARKPEQAFKQMKRLIAELPMLTAPMEKEELIFYLAATKETRGIKGSRNELHINGKISAGLGTCQPRVSVKGHILADFIIERPEEDSPDTLMEVEEDLPEPWILFTDGSSCTDGSEAGLILTTPEGMKFTYALRFRFDAINNEVEYETLIAGLRIAEQIGTRSVVAKALRIGYYWPTMHKDARSLIKACQDCQVYKPVPRNPQEKLTPITSPWPFYKWGIDIAGPFPGGPGKVKFLIVAMGYFTKWIEAK